MSTRVPSITLVLSAVLVATLGLPATVVHADTIHVCWDGSGDYLTIQEGIDAAGDGDEVVVCDGVYTGAGNKDLDFHGKAITVRSENGPEACIIDCEKDGRGLYFNSGETAASVIDGFTITNGSVHEDSPDGWYGGGIYCYTSSPTIRDCVILGNWASGSGGGIYSCEYSSPTIENCEISGNMAYSNGGGIVFYWHGSPSVRSCNIVGNHAQAGRGGGVSCEDYVTAVITECTVSANVAGDGGGGAYIQYHSDVTIANCLIIGNTAYRGAGVASEFHSYPTVTNCIVSMNIAHWQGGGVLCYRDAPTLANCTLAGNTAGTAGGGASCWQDGDPSLTNCVLWGNWPEEIHLTSGHPTVQYSDVRGGWPGNGNIDADPLFVDPDNDDFHLSGGSPCIDAGCNWAVPPDTADLDEDGDTSEYTPLDLDGEGRFFDDPDTSDTGCGCPPLVDMGAYEFGDAGPQPCLGDLNCDRVVGHSDLGILLSAWHWSDAGDLNCDGETGHADLGFLLAHWGEDCP